jgi:hypothetical protein
MTIELTARAKREAQQQATAEAAAIKSRYAKRMFHDWAGLETSLGITVPAEFKSRAFNYLSVDALSSFWANSYLARLEFAAEQATANKVKIVTGDIRQRDCSTFGKVTLFPEQEALYRRMYDDMFIKGTSQACLQDGETGSGKTFIIAACIAKAVQDGVLNDPIRSLMPFQFIVFTPKNVVEQFKRVLDDFGLAKLVSKQKILVTSYSQLSTITGQNFVQEVEDYLTGNTKLVWSDMIQPVAIFYDECQKLNNWDTWQTQCVRAAVEGTPNTKHIFLSATPFEKVNDARTLCQAIQRPIMGLNITDERSFNSFAGLIDSTNPAKPNEAALKRLRDVLGPYIYSLPRAKWPCKAINQTILVDFDNDHDRQTYQQAHEKYIEVLRKSGKKTNFGQFEAFVALGNFKKTAEPLRSPFLSRKAIENYRRGDRATVIGAAHKETIVRTAFALAESGIPRDHISIIWGGGKNLNPSDLLTQIEIDAILAGAASGKAFDKRTFRRLKLTLDYLQEQHAYDETQEQQAYRHRRMAELRLRGTQSADQRQKEIDAFQNGRARICLFTLASGGVGLSLDKDKPTLLQREGYFTPVWNGKEFKQALGRLVRRASIADAHQYVAYMRNTVEEYHIAPLLDLKLKCIAAMTNRQFEVFDLLARNDTQEVKLMDEKEASRVAEESGHISMDKDDEEDEAETDDLFAELVN